MYVNNFLKNPEKKIGGTEPPIMILLRTTILFFFIHNSLARNKVFTVTVMRNKRNTTFRLVSLHTHIAGVVIFVST